VLLSQDSPGALPILGQRRRYLQLKRFGDLVLSCLFLVLFSPVILIIAIAIKLDSRGPVVFRQERMGYDWRSRQQRPFIFYKFRSMYDNCDQSVHQNHVQQRIRSQSIGSIPERAPGPPPPEAEHSNPLTLKHENDVDARLTKLTDDCRITRVGRVLRQSSLDELPQLWNVIKGDMSLVGPRPVPLYEVAEYEPWHLQRLLATPGMTGLWQVKGRGWVTLDQMARLDIEYISRQSFRLDLAILLSTIPAVLSGRGAE
jgi:lipopolysaccharide/colanic/teichoic acid biosynthesis glycosyltransferase